VPDHSTIWRFRQLLNTENLLEPLLEQINHHLEQNSIIVSLGSINIIDATVIEAKQSRKRTSLWVDRRLHLFWRYKGWIVFVLSRPS
jgi:IS5 family transposase